MTGKAASSTVPAWLGWVRSLEGRLARRKPAPPASVRILSCDRIPRARVETLRRLVTEHLPESEPVKIYLWKWPLEPLIDLTCCLPFGACATVTFPEALLQAPGDRAELAQRVEEVVAQCLHHTSRQ